MKRKTNVGEDDENIKKVKKTAEVTKNKLDYNLCISNFILFQVVMETESSFERRILQWRSERVNSDLRYVG